MLIGVAAALLACFGYGVASVLQAYGARNSPAVESALVTSDGRPTLRSTANAVLTTAFISGMVLDVIGFAGNIVSARLIPLFLSQTIVSANLVVTAVLGIAVLGVRLRRRDWVAIATVIVSLCVLGLSSGQAGTDTSGSGLHWALLWLAMLIAALGVGLIRLLGPRAAIAAGMVAGVLYGVMAIAVRVVDGVDPLQLPVLLKDPALWAIAIAGAGGFYLFTVALQLGSVNGAVAALVVGETVMPGIVGVTLLGDTARAGLGWLVALGFCTAVAGAVAVAIFGAAAHGEATNPVVLR
ncbi:hypothetical protein [Mycolicibacter heraklionensis]|uniref:hypothetical protein n=1 Tax=Mycolicibacter heraklionensis TaxID=512402 RepID=UPI00061AC1A8|nr:MULTISPECIES: hypothetical protein [Mycobacteriaceae]OBG34745.1 hypothetical protein A5671_04090 [Mycolicibacter heraklionensis]OBJ29314.1 hypothetical protein A5631_18090 [Mycolicibacter heraklionensis]